MNSIKQLFTAVVAIAAITTSAIAGKGWETNIATAVALAKKENKSVMIEFTGSDWCPPCIMMDKKVFSKSKFTSAASANFILVKIDTPKKDKKLTKKNQKVMAKYGVRGVPTVLLMDNEGKEFARFSASQFPDVDKFLAHLDSSLEKKDLD